MLNRKVDRIRAGIWIGFLIALVFGSVGSVQASDPLLMSGIFRSSASGVKTKTALWVLDTDFFAPENGTIATMGKQGYTLTDLDINTLTGQRYYSAIFQSGVPSTEYWELAPADFANKVAALASKNIYLISLHTYVLPKDGKYVSPDDGQVFYSGVFQPGAGPQKFSGDGLDFAAFKSLVDTNAKSGYFLTSMVSFLKGGGDHYVGAFRNLKQRSSPFEFYKGDWNSMANQVLVAAANGQRLVALSNDGQSNYAGAWIAGTDAYEVVAATNVDVFNRKVSELSTAGLSPVRINIENTYRPPTGLARAFHNFIDGTPTGGYSYSVSEKGALTAVGGVGFARALWDGASPDSKLTPMWDNTRLDSGSVTKWIAAVAIYKAMEDSNGKVTPDTLIMDILGTGVLNGAPAGKYVDRITIRNLLDMNAGINDGKNSICGQGANYYDANLYATCALQNCTSPSSGGICTPPPPKGWTPPAPPQVPQYLVSAYSDPDFGILKVVIEHLTKMSFEEYVNKVLFVPLGINNPALSATDISNANCHPDLVSPRRPLYYAANQTSGPGVDDQEYNDITHIQNSSAQATQRSVTVCGNGGMQMTADQAGRFWRGLMNGKVFRDKSTLDDSLNHWAINSNFVTWSGQHAYSKNGGYDMYTNSQGQHQGATSNVIAVADTDTQVTVFKNTWGAWPSWQGSQDPGDAIVDGLNWMAFHPSDTISIATKTSGSSDPMCFNIKGGGAAQSTPIIEWTCGSKPLPDNELFVKVDSVAEAGVFMLQAKQTLFSNNPMCVTSMYDNSNAGDQIILYACNGLTNQQFKLGQPASDGFTTIVDMVSGKCLTVDSHVMPGFTSLVQQPCNASGDSSQQFSMQSAEAQ